jgi:ABC-type hemin transport system substrate-binding protein
MNKWWWLFLVVVGWIGVGFATFGLSGAHNGVGSGRQGKTSRIVSMAPNLTEILFALGLGEMVVGVSNDSDYPPEAAERKRVGTFWQPSIEAVIAAKPDLVVVLGSGRQRSLAQRLKRIGYKVLTVNIETVGDLFEGIYQKEAGRPRSPGGDGGQGQGTLCCSERTVAGCRTRHLY